MKAIHVLKSVMPENLILVNDRTRVNIVCGVLQNNCWYLKQTEPTWGKADCVILGSDKQPIYLYLIEE